MINTEQMRAKANRPSLPSLKEGLENTQHPEKINKVAFLLRGLTSWLITHDNPKKIFTARTSTHTIKIEKNVKIAHLQNNKQER